MAWSKSLPFYDMINEMWNKLNFRTRHVSSVNEILTLLYLHVYDFSFHENVDRRKNV